MQFIIDEQLPPQLAVSLFDVHERGMSRSTELVRSGHYPARPAIGDASLPAVTARQNRELAEVLEADHDRPASGIRMAENLS